MNENGLIIFVRSPELGKVKTRLAKDVGDYQALKIYKALLEHTRNTSLEVNADSYLYYFDKVTIEDEWSADRFIKRAQVSADLGVNMATAFREILETCKKAIIIGSDCPKINADIINDAFNKLDQNDVVIGPTYDGGYYLLGMKSLHTFLFESMEWSTDHVYADTIKRLEENKLSYSILDTLSDVDYKEDWDEHGWELE